MSTSPRTGLPALLLGFLAACGAESPVPAARRELARGRLDRADALLAQSLSDWLSSVTGFFISGLVNDLAGLGGP